MFLLCLLGCYIRIVLFLWNRNSNLKNKMLSFVGRLQLIMSVLSSMHIYWSSVFIRPKRVITELEAKMRGFLWYQVNLIRCKAKVSWKSNCVLKSEGGLGVRRLGDMIQALMTSHIWSILTNRKSLWVSWIHLHRLRDRNFWECKIPSNCYWSWRKLLVLLLKIMFGLKLPMVVVRLCGMIIGVRVGLSIVF